MTLYPLALYREYAVPLHAEQTRPAWASVDALCERLAAAGAFGLKSGLLPAKSATAARMTKEQAS